MTKQLREVHATINKFVQIGWDGGDTITVTLRSNRKRFTMTKAEMEALLRAVLPRFPHLAEPPPLSYGWVAD